MTRTLRTAGLFIGRFQPLHLGHLATVLEALGRLDTMLVVLGSAGTGRTLHDPFLDSEREAMFDSLGLPRLQVCHVPDFARDTDWTAAIRQTAEKHLPGARVHLVGLEKDASSFYLRLFPEWSRIEGRRIAISGQTISATEVRESFYRGTPGWKRFCPAATHSVIESALIRPDFKQLTREFLRNERTIHASA